LSKEIEIVISLQVVSP